MKKLAILALAVCIGAVAKAATCSWGATPVSVLADGATTITAVYGFDTSSLTQDAFLTLFAASDTSWANSGTEGMYDSGFAAGTIDGYANGGAVNLWAALFDDKGNVLVTATVSDTIGGNGQDPSPFLDTTDASVAGVFDGSVASAFTTYGAGWYAVPEPTSGLLLLVGGALLALKRRRA